jgi:hypothetical protein
MNVNIYRSLSALAVVVLLPTAAKGQARPPVRQIGPAVRVSSNSLASVATALAMPGGRVLVNDITARRLLLFDSTLANASVVADTTSATASAYGNRPGTLIRFRGDSALYIDIGSLSMLVISPTGTIGRVMAVPRPEDAQLLIGSIFGMPGFDAHGRLVSYGRNGFAGGGTMVRCCIGTARVDGIADVPRADSAFIVRADLATRTIDTAAAFRVATVKTRLNADAQGFLVSVQNTRAVMPLVDDWVVLPDGTIAVIRGRDYHVDWLDAEGRWTSSPKVPFDWQRLDETRKRFLIDSSVKADQAESDAFNAMREAQRGGAPPSAGAGRGAAGGGRGGAGVAASRGAEIPNVIGTPALSDLPDYQPAFLAGATHADADGNLWIRTTAMLKGQPVYDVLNRRGELIDRVQLPPFRTIAGFAPGAVYMAVKDSTGIVHLEMARLR